MNRRDFSGASFALPAPVTKILFSAFFLVLTGLTSVSADPDFDLEEAENTLASQWQQINTSDIRHDLFLKDLENILRTDPARAEWQIRRFDAAYKPFFDLMHAYIKPKFDFVIAKFLNEAAELHDETFANGENVPKPIKKLRAKMLAAAAEYKRLEGEYGKGEDRLRILAFRDFFKYYERYLKKLGYKSPLNQRVKSNLRLAWRFANYLRVSPYVGQFIWDINQPKEKQVVDGHTLATNHVFHAFKRAGEVAGYNVKVEGRENIIRDHSDGVLTFYVPNHSRPILDQIVLGHAEIIDFAILTNFVPNVPFVKSRVNDVRSIIVVGKRKHNAVDSTARTLEAWNDGFHTIIDYGQGATLGGIRELMKVRDSFILKVIKAYVDKGQPLRIVPVSMVGTDFVLNKVDPTVPMKVIIHKQIPPDAVKALIRSHDPLVLGRLIQAHWQTTHAEPDNLFSQQPRTEKLLTEIRSILSAPEPAEVFCERVLDELKYGTSSK